MNKTIKLNEIVDQINSNSRDVANLVLIFDKATVAWSMNGEPVYVDMKDGTKNSESSVTINNDHISSGVAYYITHANDKVAIGSDGEVNYHATLKVKTVDSGESGSIFIHGHFYDDDVKTGIERFNTPVIEYDDGQ